jgi:predicted lipoprotein
MSRKVVKYLLFIIAILFIAYHSVYFKNLDEVKSVAASAKFDAAAYARNYLDKKLRPGLEKAIEINHLRRLLQNSPEQTFETYSNALGIGNIRFFLVKGLGVITDLDEDKATLLAKDDSSEQKVILATEFVFGNAIRDASGLININEFNNTMDFNNVSAEINRIIRNEVLPPFKNAVRKGDTIQFTGAIELNKIHLKLDNIEVIPIRLEIANNKP